MAVEFSAHDCKRVPEPRRSGVVEQLFAAEGPLLISALNDKSLSRGRGSSPLVKSIISALNDRSEPGPLLLPVVEGISALNGKSEPELLQLPVKESISALNDKNEPGPRQLTV